MFILCLILHIMKGISWNGLKWICFLKYFLSVSNSYFVWKFWNHEIGITKLKEKFLLDLWSTFVSSSGQEWFVRYFIYLLRLRLIHFIINWLKWNFIRVCEGWSLPRNIALLYGGFPFVAHWMPGSAACFGRVRSPDFRLDNLLYFYRGIHFKFQTGNLLVHLRSLLTGTMSPGNRIYGRGSLRVFESVLEPILVRRVKCAFVVGGVFHLSCNCFKKVGYLV